MILFVRVYGRPAPEGSHEIGQHGYVMHSSKYLKAWRAAVDRDTRRAYVEQGLTKADMPLVPYPRPVYLHSIELLVGPDQCRAEGTDEPTGSPDLDKLLRATIDGLGDARAFGNDSQVTKVYELGKRRDPEPGAVIIISDEPPVLLALPPIPIRGDTSMTEYRISLERVTGRDESGLRDYEPVFELHGDEHTIIGAGIGTVGAVLGAGAVHVEQAEPAATSSPSATAPAEPAKPRGRRKSTTPEPTAPAVEPAAAEPVTSGGAEPSAVAPEPATAPTAPPAPAAPAAPVNPFARA